jgi:hypothetical protein
MNELCFGGKLPALISCHPERVFCAKDLCSWAAPQIWTEDMAVLLKTRHHVVEVALHCGFRI